MTQTSPGLTAPRTAAQRPSAATLVGGVGALVLAGWAWFALHWATPADGICLAIWPAPAGCAPERVGAAWALTAALTAGVLAAVLLARRITGRRSVTVGTSAVTLLAMAAIAASILRFMPW
ncbi:hypothetical protein [Cellulomonas bogoriensis]|nr:hypothetical protein [Cellulomonas bogoriensis]